MTLAADMALIAADTQILHDIANNDASATVMTESGAVDTVARAIGKIGGNYRGAWAGPGTAYIANDTVTESSALHRCITGHTSGATFSGDAANWVVQSAEPSNVTNAQMADMAQATIKGRASGAGTGKPVDLTSAQARTASGITSAMDPIVTSATLDAALALLLTVVGGSEVDIRKSAPSASPTAGTKIGGGLIWNDGYIYLGPTDILAGLGDTSCRLRVDGNIACDNYIGSGSPHIPEYEIHAKDTQSRIVCQSIGDTALCEIMAVNDLDGTLTAHTYGSAVAGTEMGVTKSRGAFLTCDARSGGTRPLVLAIGTIDSAPLHLCANNNIRMSFDSGQITIYGDNPSGGAAATDVRVGGGQVVAGELIDSPLYKVSGTQVVGAQKGGWTAATGSATRTTFATTTVTTEQLAERVKALVDDLLSHGLIGA